MQTNRWHVHKGRYGMYVYLSRCKLRNVFLIEAELTISLTPMHYFNLWLLDK